MGLSLPVSAGCQREVRQAQEAGGEDREGQGSDTPVERVVRPYKERSNAKALPSKRPLRIRRPDIIGAYIRELATEADMLRRAHGGKKRWWKDHKKNCPICVAIHMKDQV